MIYRFHVTNWHCDKVVEVESEDYYAALAALTEMYPVDDGYVIEEMR